MDNEKACEAELYDAKQKIKELEEYVVELQEEIKNLEEYPDEEAY